LDKTSIGFVIVMPPSLHATTRIQITRQFMGHRTAVLERHRSLDGHAEKAGPIAGAWTARNLKRSSGRQVLVVDHAVDDRFAGAIRFHLRLARELGDPPRGKCLVRPLIVEHELRDDKKRDADERERRARFEKERGTTR